MFTALMDRHLCIIYNQNCTHGVVLQISSFSLETEEFFLAGYYVILYCNLYRQIQRSRCVLSHSRVIFRLIHNQDTLLLADRYALRMALMVIVIRVHDRFTSRI